MWLMNGKMDWCLYKTFLLCGLKGQATLTHSHTRIHAVLYATPLSIFWASHTHLWWKLWFSGGSALAVCWRLWTARLSAENDYCQIGAASKIRGTSGLWSTLIGAVVGLSVTLVPILGKLCCCLLPCSGPLVNQSAFNRCTASSTSSTVQLRARFWWLETPLSRLSAGKCLHKHTQLQYHKLSIQLQWMDWV